MVVSESSFVVVLSSFAKEKQQISTWELGLRCPSGASGGEAEREESGGGRLAALGRGCAGAGHPVCGGAGAVP